MSSTSLLGEKLSHFYLSLDVRSPASQEDLHALLLSLDCLELHEVQSEHGETQEILAEVVTDCRKKALQILRSPFVESVQSIMSLARKRFQSKAMSANDTLVDLLGSWSNVVLEIAALGVSDSMLHQIITTFHARIVELAFECFLQYKRDKNLDNWYARVNESLKVPKEESSSSSSTAFFFSIVALDGILSQLTAIKDTVNRYFLFLEHLFEDKEFAFRIDGEGENRWRELDSIYIVLEYGYAVRATEEALKEVALLEIESQVFVPRAIEDVFFVLQKVGERGLLLDSDSATLSIGTKIVELLDPALESECFRLFTEKILFRHIRANRCFLTSNEAVAAFHASNKQGGGMGGGGEALALSGFALLTNSATLDKAETRDVSASGGGASASSSSVSIVSSASSLIVGSEIAEELQDVANVFMGVTSEVNSWLAGVTAVIAPGGDNGSSSGSSSSGSSISKIIPRKPKMTSSSSQGDLEMLVAALEVDADPTAAIDASLLMLSSSSWKASASTNKCSEDEVNKIERLKCTVNLSIEDCGTYLCTLAVAQASISNLEGMFDPSNLGNEAGNGGNQSKEARTRSMIQQELSRIGVLCSNILKEEATKLAATQMTKHFIGDAQAVFANAYVIDGETMERRLGDSDLVRLVGAFLAHIKANVKVHLSVSAFGVVFQQLATSMNNLLMCLVMSASTFSEWGALLFHDELVALVKRFEEASEDTPKSTRLCFAPILTATKLLTLDGPGDVKRFPIGKDLFDENSARLLLARRVEFSADAICRAKIVFK